MQSDIESRNAVFETPILKSEGKRKKCPVCNESRVNLKVHLHLEHKWSIESSKGAIGLYNLRKEYSKKKSTLKCKNYHTKKICPLPNCYKITKNIGEHLRSKSHNYKPGQEYYSLLKSAKKYESQELTSLKSPSKLLKKFKNFSSATISNTENIQLQEYNTGTAINPIYFEKPKNESYDSSKIIINDLSIEPSYANNFVHPVDFIVTENKTVDVNHHHCVSDDNNDSDDEDYIPSDECDEEVSKKLSPSIEALLTDFYCYLTGPDRARKFRAIEKVKNDVKRMFLAVGITNTIDVLFENDTDIIRKNYLQVYCVDRKLEAGSIKSYLNSLKDFCSFILKLKYRLLGLTFEAVFQTISNIEDGRKKYRSRDNIRKHQRAEDDLLMLITPEQVKMYEASKNAIIAKKLLEDLKIDPNKEINMFEYCSYRDHLLFIIHFSSAHRSGVTAHMTLEEYKRSRPVDGLMMISVWDHKTVSTYGPARVTLNLVEYEWINVFVNLVRAKLPSITSDKVFLSWSGKEMSPGDISGRLNSLWVKAGIFNGRFVPKKLSANTVRKTTSTKVFDEYYDQRKKVAGAMMHSDKTAAIHYNTQNQIKNAISGGKIVQKCFPSSPLSNDYEVEDCEQKNDYKPAITENLSGKSHFNPSKTHTPKKYWTKDETNSLNVLFPENISRKTLYSEVKSTIIKSPSIHGSPRQIYDKLNSLKRKIAEEPETKAKKVLLFDRKSWTAEQINILKTEGKELILGGPLSRSRIVDVLKNSRLIEDFTITQLRTRINHERT
nr:uncharacterized protein LOC105846615 [Hydra vulgaris]